MKKMIVALVGACSLFAFAVGAGADVSYDVTAGLDMPFGDLGDFAGVGLGIGTDVFFWTPPSLPALKVGGRVAFNHFFEDVGSATVIEFMPVARYEFPAQDTMRFFAQGGIGFANFSAKIDIPSYTVFGVTYGGGSSSNSDLEFGIALGGGVAFDWQNREVFFMPVMNLFGDAKYFGLNAGVTLK